MPTLKAIGRVLDKKMIYIIKCINNGDNFVYVETRELAIKICSDLPGLFTWEALDLYRETDYM
jgi:hypothetical protein